MGVHKLWSLLVPAGVYLSLDSLVGLTLAVDANIWILRILHGSYDTPSVDIVISSLIKRLCLLLSKGIKPVFVFDGKPPDLKRKTLFKREKSRR